MENKRFRWDCILDRLKDVKNPIGAEIGVYKGECSGHLLFEKPDLTLYMIDMWSAETYKGKDETAVSEPYRKIYEHDYAENLKHVEEIAKTFSTRSKILRMSSLEASFFFERGILDFAFIDAAHDYDSVLQDIKLWMPTVKKGGFLCGHDYGVFDGVKKVVDEFFSEDVELDSDYTWFIKI